MTWDELQGEAFVEIGLDPEKFYDMEREDYFNIYQPGYENKLLLYYRMLRWAVEPIVSSWTKFNPFTHMPLKGDDELKKMIKQRRLNVQEESLRILKMFKENPTVNMNEVFKKFKDKEANQKSKEN